MLLAASCAPGYFCGSSSYCSEQITSAITAFFPEIAQVTTAYAASGTEQLSLAPGQLILILKKNASGWWQGELQVSDSRRNNCNFMNGKEVLSGLIQKNN